jgi:perosamine synthetase
MNSQLPTIFVNAVRSVVGAELIVGLHEPDIGSAERTFVNECLDSTFVSSVGPFVTRFEDEIAAYTGAHSAIAVANGTAALHVALVLAGVMPGDEVIVPALSFVATANAVAHAGASPYFVDSSPVTLGMDVAALTGILDKLTTSHGQLTNPQTGRRVSAIVPMHTLGHPVDIEAIVALAHDHGIAVVEDAAESLGSFSQGRHTGTFGDLGILSFNGNKIVTTGGGGMILTNNAELGRRAKHLTTTAKIPHTWEFEHDEIAWNFRMPNINAAMGVGQLSKLDDYVTKKRQLAQRYADIFSDIDGLTFLTEPVGTSSNYWLNAVRINEPNLAMRNELLQVANDDGLRCRPFWNLLSEQRMYLDSPRGDLSTAKDLLESVICLPSSPRLVNSFEDREIE